MATATANHTEAAAAIRSFEAMCEPGIAFQESVLRLFADTVKEFASPARWQNRTVAFARTIAEASQENADEALDYIKRGGRSKRELVEKALRPGVNPIELWAITATVLCANVEAVWRTGLRAVENSVGLALPPRG